MIVRDLNESVDYFEASDGEHTVYKFKKSGYVYNHVGCGSSYELSDIKRQIGSYVVLKCKYNIMQRLIDRLKQ